MKYFMYAVVLVLISTFIFAKTSKTVTGKVIDTNGDPVPFATINIKYSKSSVIADATGAFSLKTQDDSVTLIVSAIGHNTCEIPTHGNLNITVTLSRGSNKLTDVVVTTALGIQKQSKSLGYATQYIAGNNTGPVVNIADGLVGKVSGLEVQTQTATATDAAKAIFDTTRYNANFNTAGYDEIFENPFLKVKDNPLSTFSIDVDGAAYSNVRHFINDGTLPPPGAVRVEEMINYFSYDYPQPVNTDPFAVITELADCPWNKNHKLALIGLQGKTIAYGALPASNLVFLIDVSGSMFEPEKLPLVKESLNLLVDQLRPQDKVSIVVYAGNAGLVLPTTEGDDKIKIKEAINGLEAGGSTAGGEGIKLAYNIAVKNFIKGGNNRVILCTDGDFNVGVSSDDELSSLIEKERETGVYLTVLGYGTDNYQDAKMQKLADKGNGNHSFIDNINEAKKVLINEFGGTLFTIAKDVKLQVEFNPENVKGYRLIGYENRLLNKEDFNNDKKDAGELGSGHEVTALYEIVPAGIDDNSLDSVDNLRYQKTKHVKTANDYAGEIMNIKLRYKKPDADSSILIQHPVLNSQLQWAKTTDNFRFAAAVAEFGMLLRNSKYKGDGDFNLVISLAKNALGNDKEGYRKEFVQLANNAAMLKANAKN